MVFGWKDIGYLVVGRIVVGVRKRREEDLGCSITVRFTVNVFKSLVVVNDMQYILLCFSNLSFSIDQSNLHYYYTNYLNATSIAFESQPVASSPP